MSFINCLPRHLRPRREKVFGDGCPRPLDRNAKARIMTLARALMRSTEKGKHYGVITAKAFAVLEALLWAFHNAKTGLCFPSYETIAAKANCHRDTVAEAIKALEAAALLSWVNRIKRIAEISTDLFGQRICKTRVVRTSNGYQFHDPQPTKTSEAMPISSKSEIASETSNQDSIPLTAERIAASFGDSELGAALAKWGKLAGAIT